MTMVAEKRIIIDRNLAWGGELQLYYAERVTGDPQQTFYAKPIEMGTLPKGYVVPGPMMQLDDNASQQLMDQLWLMGVRPRPGLRDPLNTEHLDGEIDWLRGVADHLMKRGK